MFPINIPPEWVGVGVLVMFALMMGIYAMIGLRKERIRNRVLKPYRCARCGDWPPITPPIRVGDQVVGDPMIWVFTLKPIATGIPEYRCRHCFSSYIRRQLDKGRTLADLGAAGEIHPELAEMMAENPGFLVSTKQPAAPARN